MKHDLLLRPVMVFVSGEDHYLIGWFRQISFCCQKPGLGGLCYQ